MDEARYLIYEQTIQTTKALPAVERDTRVYFDVLGYTLTEQKPSLRFERGRPVFDQVDMDPRKRPAQIMIDFIAGEEQQTIIEMSLWVQRPLLQVLDAEHEFWQAELEGLAMAIHYEFIDSDKLRFAAERVRWQRLALLTLVGMMIFFFSSLLSFWMMLP